MLTPQSRLPRKLFGEDTLSPNLRWALGFGIESTPTGSYFWHWGDNGDYKCYVAANYADRSAVVYFTNSANGLSFAGELMQNFFGGTHPAPAFLSYESYKKGTLLRQKKP